MTASGTVASQGQMALTPCESVQARLAQKNQAVMSAVDPTEEVSVYHQMSTTIEEASIKIPYYFPNQLPTIHQGLAVETDMEPKWVGREPKLRSFLEWAHIDHSTTHSVAQLKRGPAIQPWMDGLGEVA